MIKLSIIIPVYNTEAYLRRCLDSCLHQDLPTDQYEIIAVNDGSTDGSLEILRLYESNHQNIKVLSQNNQGLSVTRNNGVAIAKGKYLWFVDSDDWIKENCLQGLCTNADGANILIMDSHYVVSSNCIDLRKEKWVASQGYLFEYKFWIDHQFRFEKGIYFEDLHLIPIILCSTENIRHAVDPVYYYEQREGSIMRSNSKKHCLDLIYIMHSLYSFLLKDNNHGRNEILYYLISAFNAFIDRVSVLGAHDRSCLYDTLKHDELFNKLGLLLNRGSKIKWLLVRSQPKLLKHYLRIERTIKKYIL